MRGVSDLVSLERGEAEVGEYPPGHGSACHKSTEVDGYHDFNGCAALGPMSPVIHLVLAILIGTAVGLFTALRRYGGFVTFIVSTASFTLVLRTIRLRPIGFVASSGGIGILLVILGMYVSLAMWARERVRHTNRRDVLR